MAPCWTALPLLQREPPPPSPSPPPLPRAPRPAARSPCSPHAARPQPAPAAMLAACGPPFRAALCRAAPPGIAAFHSSSPRPRGARVAVVLSGCGVYDGTEIHEASAILVHLSRGGAEVQMYAPDVPQMHVVDHSKGQPAEAESRSTFAVDGKDCKVNREVERVLKDFHKAGKPIGLCCISPVLAAKVLSGAEVTVGHEEEEGGKWPYAGTAGAIKELGGKHCVKEVTEAHVDTKNKVVTTPAFMCETELHHIFDGIGAMVKNVLKLTGK
uniref:Glutamine amidotransferase class 1 domain containing 3 n=1 Tax=Anas platyrhynchos platyrhynchos TaxID=8840 RepID=A0A493TEZ0_ANAPP